MDESKKPSPARSQGSVTPRRTRISRSMASPGTPRRSSRLSTVVDQFKEKEIARDSFQLSPLQKTVLNDETDIEQPRRTSWWKKVNNSRDMTEIVAEANKVQELRNILEDVDVEVLSQERKEYALDLPESSDSESINSIVLPQRKLFTHKENLPDPPPKKMRVMPSQKEVREKLEHTVDLPESSGNESIHSIIIPERRLFVHKENKPKNKFDQVIGKRTIKQKDVKNKDVEPAKDDKEIKQDIPQINISSDKTIANKTKDLTTIQAQPRNLFRNKGPNNKRKNMFAAFVVSESEDEVSDIQPTLFAFQKNKNPLRHSTKGRESSPTSSITTDMDLDDWKLLPSSTMVEHQLEVMFRGSSPAKKSRLSKLSEAIESATTNSESTTNKTKLSIKSATSGNKVTNVEESHNQNRVTKEISKISEATNKENELETVEQDNNEKSKGKSIQEIERHAIIDDLEGNDEVQIAVSNNKEPKNIEEVEATQGNKKTIDIEEKDKIEEEVTNTEKIVEKCEGETSKLNPVKLKQDEHEEIDIPENDIDIEAENREENHSNAAQNEKVFETKETATTYNDSTSNKIKASNKSITSENNRTNSKDESVVTIKESSMKQNMTGLSKQNQDDDLIVKQLEDVSAEIVQQDQDVDEIEDTEENENEPLTFDDSNEDEEAEKANEILAEENEEPEDEIEEDKENDQIEVEEKVDEQADKSVNNEAEEEEIHDQTEEDEEQEENDEEGEIEVGKDKEEGEVNEVEDNEEDEENEVEDNEEDEENEVEDNEEDEDNEVEDNEDDEEVEASNAVDIADEHNEDEQQDDVSDNEDDVEVEASNEMQEESDQQSEDDDDDGMPAQDDDEIEDQSDNEANESQENEEVENMIVNESEEIEADNSDQETDEIDNTDSNAEAPQEENPNITHDTTGRHRNKHVPSPELPLNHMTNEIDSFVARGRNTSVRKTMPKNFSIRQSMAPPRESTGFSDGTKNSSAEGSGWDSHRTTRKTLRQTFGKDFTPRKSLRALVMEKSAKRQTVINEANAELRIPQANSTELPTGIDMDYEDAIESDHEQSRIRRQTTLEMYLQKKQKENQERRLRIEQQVKASLKVIPKKADFNPLAFKPVRRPMKPIQASKKRTKTIPLDDLPPEFLEDLKYKPPKRFKGSNAPWITKRLYSFIEAKLEPKYDYKSRVRAEKLVEMLFNFVREVRRVQVAPPRVAELAREMARLDIVTRHFDFYEFVRDFLPMDVKIKIVPDIVNNIPLPRNGVFGNIIDP